MLEKVRAEHKADIEMRNSKFSDVQAQVGMLLQLSLPNNVCAPICFFLPF